MKTNIMFFYIDIFFPKQHNFIDTLDLSPLQFSPLFFSFQSDIYFSLMIIYLHWRVIKMYKVSNNSLFKLAALCIFPPFNPECNSHSIKSKLPRHKRRYCAVIVWLCNIFTKPANKFSFHVKMSFWSFSHKIHYWLKLIFLNDSLIIGYIINCF